MANYPGHIISVGEGEPADVAAIQHALAGLGIPVPETGLYDGATAAAVRLYQSRSFDSRRRPLQVDGSVGPNTWGALFGVETLHAGISPAKGVTAGALAAASGEVGALEDPPGSNRGARIEAFQRSAGVSPGNPWCMT